MTLKYNQLVSEQNRILSDYYRGVISSQEALTQDLRSIAEATDEDVLSALNCDTREEAIEYTTDFWLTA